MLRPLLLTIAVCWTTAGALAQQIERRVALVIGNAGYQHVERLANPGNDAKLIAGTLRSFGFALIGGGAQLDLDKPAFDRLVSEFGKQIQGADVALFYYAGHGMQVQGSNWLLPVDANPTRVQDLDFQMVNADLVLKQMDGAGTRLNIVLLDACRNNPFGNLGTRGIESGLAQMRAPEGTLISFATQPGNVAVDGKGADGPYALALVDTMRRPGLDIFRLFNQVGLTVKQATQGAQLPWVSSSPIDGDFYFARTEATPDIGAALPLEAPVVAPSSASRATAPMQTPSPQPQQATRDAAEAGKADAQVDLGLSYAKGDGVTKDKAAAMQWFQRAADQGNARGQYFVGMMYERGYTVTRSYADALNWYHKAAAQNLPQAQIAIARFYAHGLGVPRDPAQRIAWLMRAADQGSPLAMFLLGDIYRRGLGVKPDRAVAVQWFQRAVEKDSVLAQAQLGMMYLDGNGVPRDHAQAQTLLRAAADKGNALAQNGVGLLYEYGYGVQQDYAEAQRWFRRSADQGSGLAAFNLGVMYANGMGMMRDRAEATSWLERAAATGNEPAIKALAQIERGGPPPLPTRKH